MNCNVYNKKPFKSQIEPLNKQGFEYINPKAISNSYATDFYNYENGYLSYDPRLISAFHNGQRMVLDSPPIDNSIKLCQVYTDPTLSNYGKKYNSYADVNTGDILYYIDKSREDTMYEPLFENPARVQGVMYQDPMGTVYPEYKRVPVKNNNVMSTKNRRYSYGLSAIDDINEFREDIIHLQMRRADRKRYEPRYTGDIN